MVREGLARVGAGLAVVRSAGLGARARTGAVDVFHPVLLLGRGLRRLLGLGYEWWRRTPSEKRAPTLCLVAASCWAVAVMPHGPLLAVIALVAAAVWQGRESPEPVETGPDPRELERLAALYEALVPVFGPAEEGHPSPLYHRQGSWEQAFSGHRLGEDHRFVELTLRYPAGFPDADPARRLEVERLLGAKWGRDREYRFRWDEEDNRLTVVALPPLPTTVVAQPFVSAPEETVLGFTDSEAAPLLVPVDTGSGTRDAAPVLWRPGRRSQARHLLAVGAPGSGTSTLLRSVALQALRTGELVIVDGGGAGEYACLRGQPGVLSVESTPAGARAALEWAARETERRLAAVGEARGTGGSSPWEVRRPLWVLVDRPSALTHQARAEGRDDPQELLRLPLRHGHAARVRVVVAEQLDQVESLSREVSGYAGARVVLGPARRDQVDALLGEAPYTVPAHTPPPGRGYARLGSEEVVRLQVPATPDPYDEAAEERERRAVLAMLPELAERRAGVVQAT
ncbi:hypothetical protein [Streptomyces sp. NPDC005438]|uniref:hypothetical protein n=1 Tax=Streptomyces sp. NPDC005438 TaxID=3156880 RepID=UPI0033B8D895